jgi:hypothetical protein
MRLLNSTQRASGERTDACTASLRGAPFVAAIVSASLGLRYLYRAHPSEDAFILFKYVENFVRGFGIVYYPGGPHAEGATDFLWFLLLSALRALGMDVALAACVLNALGAALASALCCAAVRRAHVRGPAAFAFGWASVGVACVNSTLAGYFGFSAMFYAATFLALACLVAWAESAIVWAPFLALALGLVRPDGVLPAVVFAALGLLRARDFGRVRRYAISSAVAVALGAAYFAWRFEYFGLPLPLPLYVKSRETAPIGIGALAVSIVRTPVRWILNDPPLVSMALGIVVLLVVAARRELASWKSCVLVAIPFVVHSVQMGYASQMQNVDGRFQAPERLALFFAVLACGAHTWRASRSPLARVLVCAACFGPAAHEVYVGQRTLRLYESARPYVDTFAPEFGRAMGKERVIALTEAGRLCFWTSARVEDTIGLNTPRTAIAPPDLEYFEELSPDVMMFHAGLTNLHWRLKDRERPVVEITADFLAEAVKPEHAAILRDGVSSYDPAQPNPVAPILMLRFLARSQRYDVFAVRYGRDFDHVYAIKKGLPEEERILDLLRASASGSTPYRSYASVRGFWLAGDPAP